MARKIDPKAVKTRIKTNKAIMLASSKIVNSFMKEAEQAQDVNARECREELSKFLKASQAVHADVQLLEKVEGE